VSFVLDCSIAVTWCFADEASPATDALLDQMQEQGAIVPALWHLEVGNVLVQAERRGRIAAGDMAARIELLRRLPITTDDETARRALRDTLALAREHGLTTYDASYLELATRRGLPLATRDRKLQEAASRMAIELLPYVSS
jgi:predicted nucleic acid-binding protein